MYQPLSIPNPAPTPPPIPFLVDVHWFFFWVTIAGIVVTAMAIAVLIYGSRSNRPDVATFGIRVALIAVFVSLATGVISGLFPESLPTP